MHRTISETLVSIGRALDQDTADGAVARGKLFELAGCASEAANSYAIALAIDPGLNEAAARLALNQLKAAENGKALDTITKLAAREPDFALNGIATGGRFSALTILGNALVANQRLDEAAEAYEAALSLNDDDRYAAGQLAQLHAMKGDAEKARSLRSIIEGDFRFKDVAEGLELANVNVALLPRVSTDRLAANLRVCMPGRPVIVEGEVRLAPLIEGDDGWCKP